MTTLSSMYWMKRLIDIENEITLLHSDTGITQYLAVLEAKSMATVRLDDAIVREEKHKEAVYVAAWTEEISSSAALCGF